MTLMRVVDLKSFLAGRLLKHKFGGVIDLISINRKVKCNAARISDDDPHIGGTQEEFETKIFADVKYFLVNAFRTFLVKTALTGVIKLLLAHLSFLDSSCEIQRS